MGKKEIACVRMRVQVRVHVRVCVCVCGRSSSLLFWQWHQVQLLHTHSTPPSYAPQNPHKGVKKQTNPASTKVHFSKYYFSCFLRRRWGELGTVCPQKYYTALLYENNLPSTADGGTKCRSIGFLHALFTGMRFILW